MLDKVPQSLLLTESIKIPPVQENKDKPLLSVSTMSCKNLLLLCLGYSPTTTMLSSNSALTIKLLMRHVHSSVKCFHYLE
ncbi:hypothetical protein Mapa_013037 [Marchantia paleacea]|nr:hypothetical protein Mapa_013037 [Marchantia paleacea]